MKAKNAAAIFDPMALDLLLPIVRGMRETKVAAIVAEMDPAKARALTAELARKREPAAEPVTRGRSGDRAAQVGVQAMLGQAEQPDQGEGQDQVEQRRR